MRQLAADRQAEAVTALAKLGVPQDHATFLGYPDRGLATLWQSNWTASSPYRSPYTGETAVPNQAARGASRPFCGEGVLEEATAALRSYRPDHVFYPDPADDHPDHWATHCFVQLALERLRGEACLARSERHTYLIHRGEWPDPMRADRSLNLSPPPALARQSNRWVSVPLTRENLDAKAAALRSYRSQEALAGNFLHAFLRRNELLIDPPVPERRLAAHPGANQVFADSTSDRFPRARCAAIDFTGVEVESGESKVKLSATLRGPVAGWPAYYLYWKPVSGAPGTIQTRRYRITGFRCDPAAARFAIEGRRLEVIVPRAELGDSTRIMVAAAAWSGPLLLDRTAWRVVNVGTERE